MKGILVLLGAVLLTGCSTPNPYPHATSEAYAQVKPGMSRQQVFEMLGTPRSFRPPGNINLCESATWSIPHDSHGFGHWTVHFAGDSVASVSEAQAMVTVHFNSHFSVEKSDSQ